MLQKQASLEKKNNKKATFTISWEYICEQFTFSGEKNVETMFFFS
jgi:hypothetical protein